MTKPFWSAIVGEGPLIALALHDGHEIREDLRPHLALADADRLREEDPHTGRWTAVAQHRIVVQRSRFEVDLNRPREKAVYRKPADAWGLQVWRGDLPQALADESLAVYDEFYRMLGSLYEQLLERHDRLLVFDLHSYNHRREGPAGSLADPEANPQLNVGTGTMVDRGRWAGVIDGFMETMRAWPLPGGPLDVRENVRFQGGHCARWTHARHPERICVLSLEFKKFFMDEWTGQADPVLLESLEQALASTVPVALHALGSGK